jgi:branched-chain amino acid transport system ATP-binding protein
VRSPFARSQPDDKPSRSSSEERLEARGLCVHFEGVTAVDEVDLELRRGEILGLIGPNGAGKTTLVNALTGFQRPAAGRIRLRDTDVTGHSPQRLARMGLTRTFQAVRAFDELTVLENVEVAAVCAGQRRRAAHATALRIVEEVGLQSRAHGPAGALPHGDARRLSIARAIARRPQFLLLDEPAAGLNEVEGDELMRTISSIRDEDACGVLVIDHDMRVIMGVCDRVQVIDYGKTISIGTPAEVQRDRTVITAYLGTKRVRRGAQG